MEEIAIVLHHHLKLPHNLHQYIKERSLQIQTQNTGSPKKKIAEILRKKNLKQRFLGHPVDIPKPLKIVPHI